MPGRIPGNYLQKLIIFIGDLKIIAFYLKAIQTSDCPHTNKTGLPTRHTFPDAYDNDSMSVSVLS